MNRLLSILFASFLLTLVACSGGATPSTPTGGAGGGSGPGSFNNGSGQSLLKPTDYILADYFGCAIVGKRLSCWGSLLGKLQDVQFENPKQLATDSTQICVLDETKVRCFAKKSFGETYEKSVPPEIKDVKAFVGKGLCASTESKVLCWGDYGGVQELPSEYLRASHLQIEHSFTCTLIDRQVNCTGSKVPFITFPLTNVDQMVTNRNHLCILRDSRVQCFANNDGYSRYPVPPDLYEVNEISASNESFCAITSYETRCWGEIAEEQSLEPTKSLKNPRGIKFDQHGTSACANTDEGLRCFGLNRSGNLNIPLGFEETTQLTASGSVTCHVSRGRANCFGNHNEYGESESIPPEVSGIKKIDNNCAMTDRGFRCWSYSRGQTGRFKNVSDFSSSWNHMCVQSKEGFSCIAHNSPPTSFTKDLYDMSGIAMTGRFACGVSASTGARCWDYNGNERALTHPVAFQIKSFVSDRRERMCAVGVAGQLSCWSEADDKITALPVPTTLPPVEQVSISAETSCAIAGGKVECWGGMFGSWYKPPETIKNPRRIAAGDEHACVLEDAGVTCFGSDFRGQLQVPKDQLAL